MSVSSRRAAGVVVVVLAIVAVLVAVLGDRDRDEEPAPSAAPAVEEPSTPDALAPDWEAELPAGETRIVRTTDDVVAVAGDTFLVGFDRASGDELWRRDIARWCTSSRVAGTGALVLATGGPAAPDATEKPCRNLTAYDLDDGAELWHEKVPPFVLNPDVDALAVGDTVVTAIGDCSVTRLRIDDGRKLSRTRFERDEDGDCFDADAATDGQVLVEFTPEDLVGFEVRGTLRVSDADTGAVRFQRQQASPVAVPVLSGAPLVLGLWPTVRRFTPQGRVDRVLLEADDVPEPVLRAPRSTYAVSAHEDQSAVVHRFDTTDGSLAWSRTLLGDVVAADEAGLTVVSAGEPGAADSEPYDVVRMVASDGQRQLLGRIEPGEGDDARILGDGDVLVAASTSTPDQTSARMYQLPPAGEYVDLRDDGRGTAALGPDDAIGACDGFSDLTFAQIGGRRDEVGLRLDCHWYAVSTHELNIRFETDVSIGNSRWAQQEAKWLPRSESLADFRKVKGAVPVSGWGDEAWVLTHVAPKRWHPAQPAPIEDNLVYGAVVRVGEISVKVLASVEVERAGSPAVVPLPRLRSTVDSAVDEIFASLGQVGIHH